MKTMFHIQQLKPNAIRIASSLAWDYCLRYFWV